MQHPPPTPHLPNDRKKHVMYATLIHSPPKIKCYFYFYYLIYTGSAISHPIQFFDYLAQQSQLKVFFFILQPLFNYKRISRTHKNEWQVEDAP